MVTDELDELASALATTCIRKWTTYPRNTDCGPIMRLCARTTQTKEPTRLTFQKCTCIFKNNTWLAGTGGETVRLHKKRNHVTRKEGGRITCALRVGGDL